MTKILYAQRSMIQAYQRCRRLRWWENYEGRAGRGLSPKKKSLHLVVGGAVHAGMEVLLREGQQTLNDWAEERKRDVGIPASLPILLDALFVTSAEWDKGMPSVARRIEDQAVAAALADLTRSFGEGVVLDPEEEAARKVQVVGMEGLMQDQAAGAAGSSSSSSLDSPIVISFDGLLAAEPLEGGNGVTSDSYGGVSRASYPPPETDEEYLKAELAALVEGMVRCWSRRRWRKTLEEFEVLEVESEGEWKLADLWQDPDPNCPICHGKGTKPIDGMTTDWGKSQRVSCECTIAEIHFLSRHDALLLERSTGYLYLQSYKTTGSWDRRKELDAQVDMQGLTEAVDVELRFGKWWHEIHNTHAMNPHVVQSYDVWAWGADTTVKTCAIYNYLSSLPDPPRVLGVRYDYLLKGSRKRDKKDALHPDRYVQESILCRAYKQEGITSEDRRWAWTYDWHDETGKGRRLDYRSWGKAPVWKFLPIGEWVDLLDKGEVQEGAMDEQGQELDPLAEQLLPIITVFRAEDDMRDLMEQIEAQEVQVARDVEEVRRAEREGGEGAKRSALNRLFPMSRNACSYPGICAYRTLPTKPGLCFAGAYSTAEAEASGDFVEREVNHPQELVQIEGVN